ncbi:conserved hypothetical protein [Corynebacterium efficiens YS-314]|uniref:N-acetyltransferase domain-containing protein n=2 Tax=Corynebacterium efficiens TaxID=152794 RepID=Q8FS56_COREF|nr:conserved hypothetical protein [Corynebacterium efficiens YS-314]
MRRAVVGASTSVYCHGMYRLTAPDAGGYREWASCLAEFGDGPIDGSGFEGRPELSGAAFEAYITDRARWADTSIPTPEGFVHCDFRWITDPGGQLLGFLAIRHTLTPFLLEQGGHIGYSVRPTYRNRGVAGTALALGLAEAQALGVTPVLLTVREDNPASRRVIERAGGNYEDTRNGFRRYWFPNTHRTP